MKRLLVLIAAALVLGLAVILVGVSVGTASAQDELPAAPTDLVLIPVADASGITLDWTDNATNEEAFVVERSDVGGTGPWVEVAMPPADSTSYTDWEVEGGATYWYRVAAVNEAGSSPYSNTASATAGFCCGPPTPAPSDEPDEAVATPSTQLQLPSTGTGGILASSEGNGTLTWVIALAAIAGAALTTAGWTLRRRTGR